MGSDDYIALAVLLQKLVNVPYVDHIGAMTACQRCVDKLPFHFMRAAAQQVVVRCASQQIVNLHVIVLRLHIEDVLLLNR